MAIFDRFMPEVVFHAAAHKHVPLMEQNPIEAVTNNIFGTANALAACETYDVKQCVLVSTDKAVRPVNVMGATKRIAELLLLESARRTSRAYSIVRFGNVLGSRGSVVPIFQNQIATGGPVTVTHPEMKRYFMTVPEAVHLIIRASALSKGGEVFVLEMGEQVKIVDLARDMIRLSGLEVGRDIDVVFTGIRPGEKLEEELFFSAETHQRTADELILVAQNDAEVLPKTISAHLADLKGIVTKGNEAELLTAIRQILPEFQVVKKA